MFSLSSTAAEKEKYLIAGYTDQQRDFKKYSYR